MPRGYVGVPASALTNGETDQRSIALSTDTPSSLDVRHDQVTAAVRHAHKDNEQHRDKEVSASHGQAVCTTGDGGRLRDSKVSADVSGTEKRGWLGRRTSLRTRGGDVARGAAAGTGETRESWSTGLLGSLKLRKGRR
jgi:hypothetical protein